MGSIISITLYTMNSKAQQDTKLKRGCLSRSVNGAELMQGCLDSTPVLLPYMSVYVTGASVHLSIVSDLLSSGCIGVHEMATVPVLVLLAVTIYRKLPETRASQKAQPLSLHWNPL